MARIEPRLELSPRFTHLVHDDGTFVLVGDDDAVVLEGKATADLLDRLDGSRTAIDVASALASTHRPELIHFALLRLLDRGIIREVEAVPHVGLGEAGQSLRRAWEERPEGTPAIVEGPAGTPVVMTDDYLDPGLAGALTARFGAASGSPGPTAVTLVRLGRQDVWIGPVVGFPASPCVGCLQERLSLNLGGRAMMRAGSSSIGKAATITRLPGEVDRRLFDAMGSHLQSPGDVITVVDTSGTVIGRHRVAKLPHCPLCGDPSLHPPGADVALTDRVLRPGSSSGYRICTPEETYQRYSPHVSRLTGVVRSIRKVEVPGTELIHVYTASHAGRYGVPNVKAIKDDARDHSGGKGMTDLDARVSALCESLERFSAVHRGTEPSTEARYSEISEEALHPHDLMLFSEAQYAGRDAWNARISGGFQWVPEPYEDQVIAWSDVRSLVSGGSRWVPSAYLYLGYRGEGGQFCKGDSNGLAGGNCLEEAILQGFFELVERDAVALWWYNRGRVPGIDLRGLELDFINGVLQYHEGQGRVVWALDLTTDLGIPCIGSFSSLAGSDRDDIIFGFGCHVDPMVALRRSITELNQMLPTVQRSPAEREKQLLPDFADAIRWWNEATVGGHPYLQPLQSASALPFGDVPYSGGSLTDVLSECVVRAGALGLETLVHDLTRADVGLAVAKVIVPGLRHFWRRTAPGRLYDVPVQLGWVDGVKSEEELNPISMFV